MNKRFSGSTPRFRRRTERERLFFVAAAGLAFSLLIITVIVFNFSGKAVAKDVSTAELVTNIPKSVGTTTVLAPRRPIPEGTKLSDIELTEMYWPVHKVPEGAIRDRSELANLYASQRIEAGSPIQRSMTSKEILQTSLAVSPGNRAVTIPVDEITGVEGHIKPGSLVDVALTYNEIGEMTSKVIVENARIISYGGNDKSSNPFLPQGTRAVYKTATLDVPQKAALQILTARKLGALSLLIKDPNDKALLESREVRETEIGRERSGRGSADKSVGNCGIMTVQGKQVMVPCNGSDRITVLDDED